MCMCNFLVLFRMNSVMSTTSCLAGLEEGIHCATTFLNTHLTHCLSQMQCFAGGGVIETNTVTASPYVITYSAHASLGNAAVPVMRFVHVYNPCLPAAYCASTGKPKKP